MSIDLDTIRQLPKVALHDHLDGGLRPQTVIDLAAETGHELPTTDAALLGRWFYDTSSRGSLVEYLQTFEHTVGVMQTSSALRRVAREFVLDQAADGVVYAEARWAPEQHLLRGLTLTTAVEAVRDGLAEGMEQAAEAGTPVIARQIVTSLRHNAPNRRVAELAVTYRHDSVAGFDLAGPEDGFPPTGHAETFAYLRRQNVRFTIHAGEAAGPESIWQAVQQCGTRRLGHGVRIVEDIRRSSHGYELGSLAAYVRDERIALEVCPSSNVMTGVCEEIAAHPVKLLFKLGFRVTISCDNRLMSNTTLSRELHLLSDAFGYDIDDLRWLTLDAARSSFLPYPERVRLIREVIEPGFDAID